MQALRITFRSIV